MDTFLLQSCCCCCCCCSHINAQYDAVLGCRTGSNNSGVEEIPQVNRGKTKNKHTHLLPHCGHQGSKKETTINSRQKPKKEDEAKQQKQIAKKNAKKAKRSILRETQRGTNGNERKMKKCGREVQVAVELGRTCCVRH